MSHGNLKILNIGDFLCPKCNERGLQQPKRKVCRACFREEKRIIQNRWNQSRAEAKADEKARKKLSAWDQTLAKRFSSMPLRPQA